VADPNAEGQVEGSRGGQLADDRPRGAHIRQVAEQPISQSEPSIVRAGSSASAQIFARVEG
jgi:hypothetical protein